MRASLVAVLATIASLATMSASIAQPRVPFSDGCGVNPENGQYGCLPGARPGVPYRGGQRGYYREPREEYYRGRREYYREREYYPEARQRYRGHAGGPVSDGCAADRFGRMQCMPGARPGVPYYGPQRPGPDGCGANIRGEYTCLPGARPRYRY